MQRKPKFPGGLVVMVFLASAISGSIGKAVEGDRTFGEDLEFLKSNVDTVLLGADAQGPRVAVVPAYQGRVMTSSASGNNGTSYGWINYEQVVKGIDVSAQINVFGGEERFWLGPEGGQYSIFFAPKAEFEFEHWQTPPVLDSEAFQIVERDATRVSFRHQSKLVNYSGTNLEFRVDRRVELMSASDISQSLGIDKPTISVVGYRTTNRLTNTGTSDWSHDSGLLSIWLLGMYKHGPQTTVVIPYNDTVNNKALPIVNDTYFGKVPAERLKIDKGVLYFAADGQHRSKIGLSPQRSTPICGSYDALRNVLTVVKYNQPGPEVTQYVNSMWELQDEPYAGDVINAYNDGPATPGAKPLGPFYELETSSPAMALKSGETGEHIQETVHFEGDTESLDRLSRSLFGASLEKVRAALP